MTRKLDYLDRRVLVTGHTGFKGAWLTHWLKRRGAQVGGFALEKPVSTPSLFQLAHLESALEWSASGDVGDDAALRSAIQTFQPEVIFHLAAQPLVRASYKSPAATWMTNVMGTVYLLEAARQAGSVRAIVVCTTDKCYENLIPGHRPFREGDPLGGYDPYSSSKAGAELVAAAWQRSFFSEPGAAAIATVRAGNVIGGGDFAEDRLIPDMVRHWRDGIPTPIRNPEATRPWQHVLEPLYGYLTLANRLCTDGPPFNGAWNFGPDLTDVQPVRWIADRVHQGLPGARWQLESSLQPHEAATLALDSAKARTHLSWSPCWNLATALDRTTEWYARWAEAEASGVDSAARSVRIRALLDADIDAYEASVNRPFVPTAPGASA